MSNPATYLVPQPGPASVLGDGQQFPGRWAQLETPRLIALSTEVVRLLADHLGRVVLAHRSRVLPESGTSFEVFVLAGAGGE